MLITFWFSFVINEKIEVNKIWKQYVCQFDTLNLLICVHRDQLNICIYGLWFLSKSEKKKYFLYCGNCVDKTDDRRSTRNTFKGQLLRNLWFNNIMLDIKSSADYLSRSAGTFSNFSMLFAGKRSLFYTGLMILAKIIKINSELFNI